MNKPKRLSGNELVSKLYNFLERNKNLIKKLKITTESTQDIKVSIIRCHAFEAFLDLLEERMFIAKWGNQHDAIKIFLNVVLLGGDLTQLEQKSQRNLLIDILNDTASYELKTRQSITIEDIKEFIHDYYKEMVKYKNDKTIWWFVFFQKRDDQKDNIEEVCLYYLVLIEIQTRNLQNGNDCFEYISREVLNLVQKLQRRVKEEDDIRKGIFSPVDNYLVVEKLRKSRDSAVKKAEAAEQKLKNIVELVSQLENEKKRLEKENQKLKDQMKLLEKVKNNKK